MAPGHRPKSLCCPGVQAWGSGNGVSSGTRPEEAEVGCGMEQRVCARTESVFGWGKNSCEVFVGLVGRNTAKWGLVSSSGNTRDVFQAALWTTECCVCGTFPVTWGVKLSSGCAEVQFMACVLLSTFLCPWAGLDLCQPLQCSSRVTPGFLTA